MRSQLGPLGTASPVPGSGPERHRPPPAPGAVLWVSPALSWDTGCDFSKGCWLFVVPLLRTPDSSIDLPHLSVPDPSHSTSHSFSRFLNPLPHCTPCPGPSCLLTSKLPRGEGKTQHVPAPNGPRELQRVSCPRVALQLRIKRDS